MQTAEKAEFRKGRYSWPNFFKSSLPRSSGTKDYLRGEFNLFVVDNHIGAAAAEK